MSSENLEFYRDAVLANFAHQHVSRGQMETISTLATALAGGANNIILEGFSGSGKSAIVDTLRPMQKELGVVVFGDQTPQSKINIPGKTSLFSRSPRTSLELFSQINQRGGSVLVIPHAGFSTAEWITMYPEAIKNTFGKWFGKDGQDKVIPMLQGKIPPEDEDEEGYLTSSNQLLLMCLGSTVLFDRFVGNPNGYEYEERAMVNFLESQLPTSLRRLLSVGGYRADLEKYLMDRPVGECVIQDIRDWYKGDTALDARVPWEQLILKDAFKRTEIAGKPFALKDPAALEKYQRILAEPHRVDWRTGVVYSSVEPRIQILAMLHTKEQLQRLLALYSAPEYNEYLGVKIIPDDNPILTAEESLFRKSGVNLIINDSNHGLGMFDRRELDRRITLGNFKDEEPYVFPHDRLEPNMNLWCFANEDRPYQNFFNKFPQLIGVPYILSYSLGAHELMPHLIERAIKCEVGLQQLGIEYVADADTGSIYTSQNVAQRYHFKPGY